MTDLLTTAQARARGALAVETVDGARRVLALLPELDGLVRRLGLPVTAGTSWMRAGIVARDSVPTWAVGLRSGDRLLAAGVVQEEEPARPVLLGGGSGYVGGVVAEDEELAERLGRELATAADRRGHERLVAGLLPDDGLTRAFARGLGTEVHDEPGIPVLVPDRGPDLAAYLSSGTARTLRKGHNRLAADGRTAELTFTRCDVDVVRMLPELGRLRRTREEQHGVESALASDSGVTLWTNRVRRLLDSGCLELTMLMVDGGLAAYVLSILDGGWYRVLEGSIDAAFARYAPGRLVEAAALSRALADGAVGVDWMTSVAPEALLAATARTAVISLGPSGSPSGG